LKKLNKTYKNGNFNLCEFALIRLPGRILQLAEKTGGYTNIILDKFLTKFQIKLMKKII